MREELKNKFAICECGRNISSKLGHRKRHFRSIFHRRHKSIRALLKKNCLSFVEIGKRLGVSYERVRQINAKLGFFSGNQRSVSCSVSSSFQKWNSRHHIKFLKSRDMDVRPILNKKINGGNFSWRTPKANHVRVNGRICLFKKSWHRPQGTEALYAYRAKDAPEFFLVKTSRGHLIIPCEDYPRRGTCLTWNCHPDFLNRSEMRISEYLERWDLLSSPKKTVDTGAQGILL